VLRLRFAHTLTLPPLRGSLPLPQA
jgi:hypothetical protein